MQRSVDLSAPRSGAPRAVTVPASARRRTSRGLLAALGAGALLLAGCSEESGLTTPDGSTISKSTTRIAEVNIVAADRDFADTCLAPTAPDTGRDDVDRIVVTDPALLDAICALGIGPKVSAIAAAAASVPAYLGPQLGGVPTIGVTPDAAAIDTADADLVLTTPATEDAASGFDDVREVSIAPGDDWREQFTAVAEALGRSEAGAARLDEFDTEAAKTGRRMDAAHSQVSLVRFTADGEVMEGTDNFAAGILAAVGVQRPATQRGGEAIPVTDDNFTDVDADLIYVGFDGPEGQARGEEVLLSDRWLDMGAPTWKRVLLVDDAVWYRSSGLAAAWLVLNDLKSSLDGNSAGH